MKVVYKYQLELVDIQTVKLPAGAEVIHAATQRGFVCIWVVADTEQPEQNRMFRIAGTGHELKENRLKHLGSFMMHGDSLVFHLFEVL